MSASVGFTKKAIDKYIRVRIRNFIWNLGRDAHLYLRDELGVPNSPGNRTDDEKVAIENFQFDLRNDIIVTGGCFTSMLQGDLPNDLDVYFKTKETATLVATFFLNKTIHDGDLKTDARVSRIEVNPTDDGINIMIKSQGVTGDGINTDNYQYFENTSHGETDAFFDEYRKRNRNNIIKEGNDFYTVSFITSNAITLKGGIQLILRFTGDADQIHTNFDFVHATNYWTWGTSNVYNSAALVATIEKRLRYVGSKFPVATIFRLKKFIERGWRISAGEMVKIMYDISHLNLDDVEVLRDQSMGMDSAYFREVIAMLQNRDEGQKLDRTYLFQTIALAFDHIDTLSDDEELDEYVVDNTGLLNHGINENK